MDLFDDEPPEQGRDNSPEFTVSELSGAVKRVIEGEFGLVRVRGEIGRVSRPASGHLYYDLKDDKSVIAAITWKGQASRLSVRPEEGMEVVATGRMTTFPGQSKYQLIIDDIAPAGAGALMAMLEKRRVMLQAEGLFDPARKRPIPWLPKVIGVVTSPSGAVIRDILHRLRDRFPRHVLIWPVAVQGEKCAPEVAAAIRGFNALPENGAIPRPDLLIVARGGGSLEDLWGFNEEVVVRAAAESRIPLISAVGHETDTTLIDFASDLRAPTPTAAAEFAVPVRLELLANLSDLSARIARAMAQSTQRRRQRLTDLARALPRAESLTQSAAQRLDHASGRLASGLGLAVTRKRGLFEGSAGRMRPELLLGLVARRRDMVKSRAEALEARLLRRMDAQRAGYDKWASRLEPALHRLTQDGARKLEEGRQRLEALAQRLDRAPHLRIERLKHQLASVDRTRQSLGYDETLRRGFAVVWADGKLVTDRAMAADASALEIQFQDGRLAVRPGEAGLLEGGSALAARGGEKSSPQPSAKASAKLKRREDSPPDEGQGSLF